MSEKPSQSDLIRYLGMLVAGIAIVGFVVFDWRFGESNSLVPFAIGAGVAILAVGLTLFRWLSSSGL